MLSKYKNLIDRIQSSRLLKMLALALITATSSTSIAFAQSQTFAISCSKNSTPSISGTTVGCADAGAVPKVSATGSKAKSSGGNLVVTVSCTSGAGTKKSGNTIKFTCKKGKPKVGKVTNANSKSTGTNQAGTSTAVPSMQVSAGNLPHVAATTSTLKTILGIFFGVIGALALLTITVSGLRYITSAGDAQKAANARNGLIYALIGLAIAVSAEAIVAFVIGRV